jgi:hypothetical protein
MVAREIGMSNNDLGPIKNISSNMLRKALETAGLIAPDTPTKEVRAPRSLDPTRPQAFCRLKLTDQGLFYHKQLFGDSEDDKTLVNLWIEYERRMGELKEHSGLMIEQPLQFSQLSVCDIAMLREKNASLQEEVDKLLENQV